ncbi:MAG: YlxM family DNA-binding protein [Oscillospiraceae bacterium]|nr:YlxM family DNA-binding protein [Oscillospiraceae bacterium]
MEESVFRTMLFDFYGELLTEKQREYFDLHYNEDLSLAEIAQSEGISRQGVWDIIRRAEEALRRFEEKTELVARFAAQRELLRQAEEGMEGLLPLTDGEARDRAVSTLAIIKELRHGI